MFAIGADAAIATIMTHFRQSFPVFPCGAALSLELAGENPAAGIRPRGRPLSEK
jgi:hypothetical protein